MDQLLGSSSRDRLAKPVRGGHSLSTEERRTLDLSPRIKGWGTDRDPAVRPGVPRDKAPGIGNEFLYLDIEPQVPRARIHKSTEHARLTPVFGTACPPRGLSGLIRNVAYTRSEGRLSHWLLLMTADRVNVAEDVVSELLRLEVPNVPREMGLNAAWRYNRRGVVTGAAIAGAAALVTWVALSSRKKSAQ